MFRLKASKHKTNDLCLKRTKEIKIKAQQEWNNTYLQEFDCHEVFQKLEEFLRLNEQIDPELFEKYSKWKHDYE